MEIDITKLLTQSGLSSEQLAVKLGVSVYTLAKWRRGEHKPSRLAQKQLEKQAQRLGYKP